jgi:hypothetical protein
MAKLILPDDPDLATKVLNVHSQQQERGMIGHIFGSRNHAPTNIGGTIAVLAMVGLVVSYFIPDPGTRADAFKTFGAIVFSALGYVFGSVSAAKE